MVPKEIPEPRGTLAYPAPLGQRETLAPLALPELKAILVVRVILGLLELQEPPEQPVPLVLPEQWGPLALLVLAVSREPLAAAC